MLACFLYACSRPAFVSHLSEENAKLITRKAASKHYFLSRMICFDKKCRRFISWRNKHKRRRFKGYKTPGIPKRYEYNEPIIADDPIIATKESGEAPEISKASIYDNVQQGTPTEFKNATFTTNSFELVHEFQAELKEFASYLLSHPRFNVKITGHTDDVGNREANQKLSENRAKAVVNFLIAQGVEPSRLSYEGKGDSVPVDTGFGTSSARANRRVEFQIKEVRR